MESERNKFQKAIGEGIKELRKYKELGAKDAFYLYETFGLPFELIRELAPEASRNLVREAFEKEFKKHQEVSRAGAEKKFGGHGLLLDTGELKAKDEAELKKVTRLHTATHLLQAALRKVLGSEVKQGGSDITAERTRFDFNFPRKITPEEIKKVEDLVNEIIQKDLPVGFVEMPKEKAEKTGALYFFKEKYPAKVKVYYVGHSLEEAFSKEFCSGPHVGNTLVIGQFKIIKEESVAAGIRRIRAIVLP
jgi:alanyl-tRNA synthetase